MIVLVEQFNELIHLGMKGHIPFLTTKLEDSGAIGAAMLPMSKLKKKEFNFLSFFL